MQTRYIQIGLFMNEAQIDAVEAQKAKLENDGWTLVETTCGAMRYQKPD